MKILNDNWEFDVLGIYNYNKTGKLMPYYSWIMENHDTVEGDILEAGVFNGKSLLATAMLLKELGSNRKVYGFDSFSGFPPVYHDNDDLSMFDTLYENGLISKQHYEAHNKLKHYRSMLKNENVTVKSISSSDDFSGASLEGIKKKIELLGLDNIILVKGDFSGTMVQENYPNLKLMAGLLDCDLYLSYQTALPFIWQRLSPGGYMWLDEYYSLKFPGAKIACDNFFSVLKVKPRKYPQQDREFERWFAIKQSIDNKE
jgi:hypothetical protein